jgi:hypothetical protein
MSFSPKRAFLSIALIVFAFSAQFAFGNPMQTMRLYAADDNVQDTIIARSGVFDPSDSYMTWADTCHCENTNSGYYVYFEYRGTTVTHNYYTYNLTPGLTYTAGNGPVWVGPSNSHELVMRKSNFGGGGCLSGLKMRVYYYAGGSD